MAVTNIDILYVLQPLIITIASIILVLYWHYKKSFTKWIFVYSLVAYALAIIIKTVFQHFTALYVVSAGNLYIEGVYYGLQTVILEVGLAYVFASYAIKKKQMSAKDASGYGIGLAFWENGVLLGLFSIINVLALYLTLASGSPAAAIAYNAVSKAQPSLFYPAMQALPLIGLGLLERTSSFMVHFSWGYLVLMAAFYRKKKYLAIALPMGLVDFFVPFSKSLGLANFEILIFAIAIASILVVAFTSKSLSKTLKVQKTRT